MIIIKECNQFGYAARTEQNVKESDVTIAIAKDFSTGGEKLTKSLCRKHRKLYIPLPYKDYISLLSLTIQLSYLYKDLVINIAGNGIYTLHESQDEVDEYVFSLLEKMIKNSHLEKGIKMIRSGGQTGIDEAGVKAADKLGIEALVLAPKGFIFRDINGIDIKNEQQFKNRFI